MRTRLAPTLPLLLLAPLALPAVADAHEGCKSALAAYSRVADSEPARQQVLTACAAGSHGRDDALLAKLLARCATLFDGHPPAAVLSGCRVDAYRYIGWGEYP